MTGLPPHLDDACDTIDAALFTGDLFYRDPVALEQLESYMAQWLNIIEEIKQFVAEAD